jgi:hypothetical protein
MNSFLALTATLVVSFLALSEFADWSPFLARRIIRRAVRRIPEEHRVRYEEEWAAELEAVEGKLSKLFLACGVVLSARSIGKELRSTAPQPMRKPSRRQRNEERSHAPRLERAAQVASVVLVVGLVAAMVGSAQLNADRVAIAAVSVAVVSAVLSIGYFFVRRSERESLGLPGEPPRVDEQLDQHEASMRVLKGAFAALMQADVPREKERAAEEAADVVVTLIHVNATPDSDPDVTDQPQRSFGDDAGLQPGLP